MDLSTNSINFLQYIDEYTDKIKSESMLKIKNIPDLILVCVNCRIYPSRFAKFGEDELSKMLDSLRDGHDIPTELIRFVKDTRTKILDSYSDLELSYIDSIYTTIEKLRIEHEHTVRKIEQTHMNEIDQVKEKCSEQIIKNLSLSKGTFGAEDVIKWGVEDGGSIEYVRNMSYREFIRRTSEKNYWIKKICDDLNEEEVKELENKIAEKKNKEEQGE